MSLGAFEVRSASRTRTCDKLIKSQSKELHPKSVERARIQNILDVFLKDHESYQANRVFQIIGKMFNWGLGTYVDISPC